MFFISRWAVQDAAEIAILRRMRDRVPVETGIINHHHHLHLRGRVEITIVHHFPHHMFRTASQNDRKWTEPWLTVAVFCLK